MDAIVSTMLIRKNHDVNLQKSTPIGAISADIALDVDGWHSKGHGTQIRVGLGKASTISDNNATDGGVQTLKGTIAGPHLDFQISGLLPHPHEFPTRLPGPATPILQTSRSHAWLNLTLGWTSAEARYSWSYSPPRSTEYSRGCLNAHALSEM